jgi:signal peptidase I
MNFRERGLQIWASGRGIFLMVLIVSSMRSALADWNDVPTGSMKPTILEGDRVIVNKLAYDLKVPFSRVRIARWSEPQRGDVIVFYSPADGMRLVKRVIGLPGDTVAMRDEQLFINGEWAHWTSPSEVSGLSDFAGQRAWQVEEAVSGIHHMLMITENVPALRSFEARKVPAGEYFVMGDNRDDSNDSRYIGFIKREAIVGKATAVAFSFDRANHFKPRFDRFMTALR